MNGRERGDELASATILVVDDEPRLGKLTAELLSQFGYRATVAQTGREALLAAEREKGLRLILLDVHLPDIEIADLLQALAPFCANLPVVLMSGYAEEDLASLLALPSVRGYLPKPYPLDTLLEHVRRYC